MSVRILNEEELKVMKKETNKYMGEECVNYTLYDKLCRQAFEVDKNAFKKFLEHKIVTLSEELKAFKATFQFKYVAYHSREITIRIMKQELLYQCLDNYMSYYNDEIDEEIIEVLPDFEINSLDYINYEIKFDVEYYKNIPKSKRSIWHDIYLDDLDFRNYLLE